MKNKYSKELRAVARHYKTTPQEVLKAIDAAVTKVALDKAGKSDAACHHSNDTIH
jgi:hypothetical protein